MSVASSFPRQICPLLLWVCSRLQLQRKGGEAGRLLLLRAKCRRRSSMTSRSSRKGRPRSSCTPRTKSSSIKPRSQNLIFLVRSNSLFWGFGDSLGAVDSGIEMAVDDEDCDIRSWNWFSKLRVSFSIFRLILKLPLFTIGWGSILFGFSRPFLHCCFVIFYLVESTLLIMWVIAVIIPGTCFKLISTLTALLRFSIVAHIALLVLASYKRVSESTLLWDHRYHRCSFTTQPLHGCPLDFFKSIRGFLILLVTIALLRNLAGVEVRNHFPAMSRRMKISISIFLLSSLILARFFYHATASSMLGDLEAFVTTDQVRTDSFASIAIDFLPQQARSKESFWRLLSLSLYWYSYCISSSVIPLRFDLCTSLSFLPAFRGCNCCYY